MKKYGPYDDQARYPHDYFVYQKTDNKLERKDSYARGYDEFDDFVEEDHRPYQRERDGHRYFRFEGGSVSEKKKGPQIWAGKETGSESQRKKQQKRAKMDSRGLEMEAGLREVDLDLELQAQS